MGWFRSLLIIFFPFFHIMVLLVWQSWWPYRSKQTSQKAPTTDQQFLCTFSLYQSPHGYRYEATSRQLCEEICWGDLINHTPVWTPLQMTSLTDVNTHMTLWEQEAAYKLMLSKVGLESKVCELHSHYLQFGSRLARSFRILRLHNAISRLCKITKILEYPHRPPPPEVEYHLPKSPTNKPPLIIHPPPSCTARYLAATLL